MVCLVSVAWQTAYADDALIAVATNFFSTAKQIEMEFERTTEHDVTLVSGSTGKLFAQIRHGAPFHAFLAADSERPTLLVGSGLAVMNSQFTYALGQLALATSTSISIGEDIQVVLRNLDGGLVAIANPALAPYGKASQETLRALQVWTEVKDRLVLGDNVGQTYSMVATGNVALGFVALSHVTNPANSTPVSYTRISSKLHDPIRQDAILLKRGAKNVAARAFLAYLRSAETRAMLLTNGYGVE